MATNKELIEIRQHYVEWMRREILGPGSEMIVPDAERELISEAPDKRYSTGILFPKEQKMDTDNDDTVSASETAETDDSDEETEESIAPEEGSLFTDGQDPNQKDLKALETPDISEDVCLSKQNKPASCGMTFFATGNTEHITCHLKWGSYRKARVSDCLFPFELREDGSFTVSSLIGQYVEYQDGFLKLKQSVSLKLLNPLYHNSTFDEYEKKVVDALYQMERQLSKGYVRSPHEETITLDLSRSDSADYIIEDDKRVIRLTAVRYHVEGNTWSLTIAMVNDSAAGTEKNKDRIIFQPEVHIHTNQNQFTLTTYRSEQEFNLMTEEDQYMDMLYRSRISYGTGLGCAVEWNVDQEGNGSIWTDFIPTTEVSPLSYSIPSSYGVDSDAFSMKHLSDNDTTTREEKLYQLSSIADGYEKWIGETRDRIKVLEDRYQPLAKNNLKNCEEVCRRIREGISILAVNDEAWEAFTYANHAMLLQRVMLNLQNQMSNQKRFCNDPELENALENLNYQDIDPSIHTWRPFQIAFLLMSIASVVDDNAPDRKLVDLIWFPTGGGKTEAYLGLTAMTIFYRRLHYGDSGNGTAVLMRYTLRLLTGQQFSRASTLICACEFLRKKYSQRKGKTRIYKLGEERITIGLWIGGIQTPNTSKDVEKALANLTNKNPFQVLKCPWCGASLEKEKEGKKNARGQWGYEMEAGHFLIACNHNNCFFCKEGSLPIQVVDYELYKNPPTLLFSTVDKFAMLPWREETGHFFATNSDNRTPELIIQDELHLISGPLGSIVGLYETAIDCLCSAKGISPKIIASTATIRHAGEQCAALYARDMIQFPPPGIDAEDSFFSREAQIDHKSGTFGRLYVGLMPSGKSKVMMETSVVSAMMQRTSEMGLTDEQFDLYWTLLIYFSSLRELGKCRTLLDTDIRSAMRAISNRLRSPQRHLHIVEELTSSVSGAKITKIFDMLEKVHYSKADTEAKRYACDAVLATNMVSVGLDVERLNTMLIVTQPKLTSEYIQASSRIGRKYPGCAFILYDSSRSRDRSHYEQFKLYHQTFYQFVEPSGVTPFSEPVKERALHAVVISMMRHMCRNLAEEKSAGKFSTQAFADEIQTIVKLFVEREKTVQQRVYPEQSYDSTFTEEMIHKIFDEWSKLAAQFEPDKFIYGKSLMLDKKKVEENEGRLLKEFYSRNNDSAFETMTSMRNIDVTIEGKLVKWE